MEGVLQFRFREKNYSAQYFICQNKFPIYVFIFFSDPDMRREFGEDICIHTDGINLIAANMHSETRTELHYSVFAALKDLSVLQYRAAGKTLYHYH